MGTINYVGQKLGVRTVSTESSCAKKWGHNRPSRSDITNHDPITVKWHELLRNNDFIYDEKSENYEYKGHVISITGTACTYQNKNKIVRGTWSDMVPIIKEIRASNYCVTKPVNTVPLKKVGTPVKVYDRLTWLNREGREINKMLIYFDFPIVIFINI